jgi:hypothetical protein
VNPSDQHPAEPHPEGTHGDGHVPVDEDPRWLDDPKHVTLIVRVLMGLCALAFLADLFYTKHPFFGVEEFPAFYAIYGFVVSTALVLTAKQLRKLVGRPEDYYERRHDAD